MKINLTIKTTFAVLFAGVAVLSALTIGALLQVKQAAQHAHDASEARYDSFLLATELRQSSDALTRLTRSYVATGDERWREHYQGVLDIRAGEAPRPENYVRGHWDFLAANQPSPRALGEPRALLDLMREAGFSEQEMALLGEAEALSGQLAALEAEAFAEVAAQASAEPSASMLQQVFGDEYHARRADIMVPIERFYAELENRTAEEVATAQQRLNRWNGILLSLLFILLVTVGGMLWWAYANIVGRLRQMNSHLEQMAKGDLSEDIHVESHDEIGKTLASLQDMQAHLRDMIHTIQRAALEITAGSEQISSGNTDLSQRTEEQAASLQETAASMEQVAATVRNNMENIAEAHQLTSSASQAADAGGRISRDASQKMEELNASSEKIKSIMTVIDSIAFQTNILALNASVEAARAGEQGRGFAVVASEVRNLAQRSAEAAKEIQALIEVNTSLAEESGSMVSKASHGMEELVTSIEKIALLMGEVKQGSQEQTFATEQVSVAVNQMDQVTQQNASLVQETANASSSLEEQATHLRQAVAIFRL